MSSESRGAILITGTSTGIGRATALHLDDLGFRVFATVRNAQDANALHAEGSEKLTPVLLDVTDEVAIKAGVDEIGQAVGEAGLWGLVNNAGVGFTGPLEFVPLDELRWLFEVNVFGPLALCQAFLPLIRRARGRIVNVSSSASLFVAPFHGPYSAAKRALNGFSDAMRLELRPFGVHVATVLCGSVQTPIWEKGGQLALRIAERYPPEMQALYGSAFQQLGNFFRRMGGSGVTPEVAAKTITHSVTATKPKNTYFVGTDARLFNLGDKLVHGRLREWLLMRTIGLNA
jgi:NAD(P)-dependent dehydrogenase (short-subunit alcohol dehydrogenase family)